MKPKLLVIVGPTAVGKTRLSVWLAKRFHGEIISGDSMQVYRGMDIGTAKIMPGEMEEIPHHLIDIRDPDQLFSVQEYQKLAREKIAEITEREQLPMLVGGTGLYIESVVHDYAMPHVKENMELRKELKEMAQREGKEALHRKLEKVDPVQAHKLHPNDVRRIIRALEVYHVTGKPFSELKRKGTSPYDALWIGLTMPRELLYERINRRVDEMIASGLVDEVKQLWNKGYRLHLTSMQAIGYKEIMSYLEGDISFDEAVHLIKLGSRKYAKRQLSWFRRLSEIHWFDITNAESFQEIELLIAGKFHLARE
ncbi:tRNA (adenosine(37)-N6)-dimethylallyltransferase MiaA [Thermoactinomyces mirandus]|uniref:tRNA dimethylallyltransferase n=1 Tax=Thermoactinomyces mirandus TaxID=2756294 RepID=A0A7W1XSJ5_9BACL|nr:tRNA (adenosine(37)-N6)-dimethylallyltransferase MiaA [Thermoactinomyces mirandus]MBA4602351.1 tRNA (adenosine(37)-N6)-dimethylallyltransferase MiaA [Thermoactinomyces mirandus]